MSETQADRLPPPPAPGRRRAKAAQIATLFVPVTVLLFFVIRTTGYPLLSRHDVRVGSYVLDAVQNGNWIIQKDYGGEIAAKPPLITWCAAVTTLLDRLGERELLVRVRSEADRRTHHLRLSRKGGQLARQALEVSRTMERELVRHLSEAERAILMELLQKVARGRRG